MAKKSLLGNKVRRLRRGLGVTQVKLAGMLGISPSYLNLIEHNQRPLTLPLVRKLSRTLDIDLATFSEEDEARLVANLDEVFGDALFKDKRPTGRDIEGLAGSAPELCRAVLALYQAYRNADENANTLKERLTDDSFLSAATHELLTLLTSIRSFSEILRDNADIGESDRRRFFGIILGESDRLAAAVGELLDHGQGEGLEGLLGANSPAAEVTDFIERHGNHFPEIEAAAAAVRKDAKLASGDPGERLAAYLARRCKTKVETVPAGTMAGAGARYDEESRTLILSELLAPASARFQMARQIGRLAVAQVFEPYLGDPNLTTPASRAMCAEALAKYLAGALVLPYDEVIEAAHALRYDVELMAHRFDASFEQICHRLTTLRRAGAAGVPFHFVRVDIAGNVSKRFSGSGMRLPRFGNACPRWTLHAAFLTPGAFRARFERLPDGTTYFAFARSVTRASGGHNAPKSHYAIGLGCAASYADRIVYADGMAGDDSAGVVPIGVSCRLCERRDCAQRAFPPFAPAAGAEPVPALMERL